MKLHYSLLTIAIAFITGSNLFAIDATEAKQSMPTEEQLEQLIDGIQSIKKLDLGDDYISFEGRLKEGKSLYCQNFNNHNHRCMSFGKINDPYFKSESPQFFAILQKMYEKQQKSQTK